MVIFVNVIVNGTVNSIDTLNGKIHYHYDLLILNLVLLLLFLLQSLNGEELQQFMEAAHCRILLLYAVIYCNNIVQQVNKYFFT